MSFIKKACSLVAIVLLISPAYAAGELAGKTLYVSVDPTTPPFSTLADDFITPIGLDVDIIIELQKRLGFEIAENRILPMMRSEQMKRIKNNQLDLVAGCLSATADRAKYLDFSPVYYDTGLSIIYSKSKYNKVTDFRKFNDAKVGAVEGTVSEHFIDRQLQGAQKVIFPSFMIAMIAVTQGTVDAIVYDRPLIEYFAQSMPDFNLEVIDDIYERQYCQIALGFSKNSPYTFIISKELYNMKKDGTLDAIIDKYIK